MNDKVTAIIKTLERPEKLMALHKSLRSFYPKMPVVIVDDSREPMSCLWDEHTRYIHAAYDIGLSEGRNVAVRAVQTPYTLLLDDDFLFTPKTKIEIFLAALETTPFSIIAGDVYDDGRTLRSYKGLFAPFGDRLRLRYHHKITRKEGFPLYDFVNNFFLARTALLRQFPWDPELKIREHEEFFWRLKKAGILTTHTSAVAIDHYPDDPFERKGSSYYQKRYERLDSCHALACKKIGVSDYFFDASRPANLFGFEELVSNALFALRKRREKIGWGFLWKIYVLLHALLFKRPGPVSLMGRAIMPARRPWNVLIFPAGNETAKAVRRALCFSKEVVLHETNDETASGLSSLQRFIIENQISAIFPTTNKAAAWLSDHSGELQAAILTAPRETCVACADLTALKATLASRFHFSNRRGSPGTFYTIDCLSQTGKGVLFACARRCMLKPDGLSIEMTPAPEISALKLAKKIEADLPMRGVWSFRVTKNRWGRLDLLDVAPLLSEDAALTHAGGPNLPLLALFEAAGFALAVDYQTPPASLSRKGDKLRFTYHGTIDALYIDFDDLLVFRGQVNESVVSLIRRFRARGLPVCLASKHPGDLTAALKERDLESLFDRIEHMPSRTSLSKAEVIREKNALLIDDSFYERKLVKQQSPSVRCLDAAGALCLWNALPLD